MSVQIIINGDTGRMAAVELRSFTDNVADLFRAEYPAPIASQNPSDHVSHDAPAFTHAEAEANRAEGAPEPAEAVEEAPKKRGRPAKKAAEPIPAPKPEPTPEPETAEEEEEETDEDDDAPVEDDMVAGYAVTEEGFRAAFRAWAERHEQDYVMENGVKMIGASKIPDLVAQGTAAIAEALRRVVADSAK